MLLASFPRASTLLRPRAETLPVCACLVQMFFWSAILGTGLGMTQLVLVTGGRMGGLAGTRWACLLVGGWAGRRVQGACARGRGSRSVRVGAPVGGWVDVLTGG